MMQAETVENHGCITSP